MNTAVYVDTRGLDKLAAGLSAQEIDRAVVRAALDAEGGAKIGAPVDTGALRNSIQARASGPGEAIVGVGMLYGPYVEYGTYKMRARPFLGPALEKAVVRLRRTLENLFRSVQ